MKIYNVKYNTEGGLIEASRISNGYYRRLNYWKMKAHSLFYATTKTTNQLLLTIITVASHTMSDATLLIRSYTTDRNVSFSFKKMKNKDPLRSTEIINKVR